MNIRLEHPGLDFVDPLSFSHPLRNYRRVANRKKLSQQAITCAVPNLISTLYRIKIALPSYREPAVQPDGAASGFYPLHKYAAG